MSKAILPKHEAAIDAVAKASGVDREAMRRAVLEMLVEDRRLSYKTQQPAVAVSASVAIAKMMGLMDGPPAPTNALNIIISGSDVALIYGTDDTPQAI